MNTIFHLAIPTRDVRESVAYYKKLGADLGRSTDGWAILNFYGVQLVLHIWPVKELSAKPTMYPRHFGVILPDEESFNGVYGRAQQASLNFFQDIFKRFAGQSAEHETFFLQDPSNNVIEFKWYKNRESIFGSEHNKTKGF